MGLTLFLLLSLFLFLISYKLYVIFFLSFFLLSFFFENPLYFHYDYIIKVSSISYKVAVSRFDFPWSLSSLFIIIILIIVLLQTFLIVIVLLLAYAFFYLKGLFLVCFLLGLATYYESFLRRIIL